MTRACQRIAAGGEDGHVKVGCIDDTVALKLDPNTVASSTWKNQVELQFGTAIGKRWMRVNEIDQIVTCNKHVSPGSQILFVSFTRSELKPHLRQRSRNGRWRVGGEFDSKVLGGLGGIIADQRLHRRFLAGYEDRFGDQLRRCCVWIKIRENAVHAWLRKRDLVRKRVAFPDRMLVREELKIAADEKEMKKPLVDGCEACNDAFLPRLTNLEPKPQFLARLRRFGRRGQIHVIFHWIRDARNKLHAATRADPRISGANVSIHGAGIDQILPRIWERGHLRPGNSEANDEQNKRRPQLHAQCIARRLLQVACLLATCLNARAHDISSAPVTWNREISRVIYQRCASCHHKGGGAFSLMTFEEAQPRAAAIKEAVLARRMPPWGAVKGFGEFRNDQALSQEEIELITDWVEGDTVRGSNPNVLPKAPAFPKPAQYRLPKNALVIHGESTILRPIILDGILPKKVPEGQSVQLVAVLPDGEVVPLLWLYGYDDGYKLPFLFRRPIQIPVGTRIRGLPAKATIVLIPAQESPKDKRSPQE